MRPEYKIEIDVTPKQSSYPLKATIEGFDLFRMKSEINKTVDFICKKYGCKDGDEVYVEICITKQDEWYDCDEGPYIIGTGRKAER